MATAPAAAKVAAPLRKIESVHKGIRNCTKRLLQNYEFTQGEPGARAYKRTFHSLGDILIRIYEALAEKMIHVAKINGKQTVGMSTFVAGGKLLPSVASVISKYETWSRIIEDCMMDANGLASDFKELNAAAILAAMPQDPTMPTDAVPQTKSLNWFAENEKYFIQPTLLRSLVKLRLPIRWRLGDNVSLPLAMSILGTKVADLILGNVAKQSGKDESVAPRHISKAVEYLDVIKSVVGNPVFIGTPLSHRPQIGRKAKVHRRKRDAPDVADDDDNVSPPPPLKRRAAPSPSLDRSSSSDGGSPPIPIPPKKKA
jgi:hypothetical protein